MINIKSILPFLLTGALSSNITPLKKPKVYVCKDCKEEFHRDRDRDSEDYCSPCFIKRYVR